MDPVISSLFAIVALSLVSDLGFAFLFLKTASLRSGPGQLILTQSQAQILLDLHWLSFKAVWKRKSEPGCQIVAFFTYAGFVTSCAYAAVICVAVRKYGEVLNYLSLGRYHATVLTISLAICVVLAIVGGFGPSTFGDCSLRTGTWTWTE